MNIKNNKIIRVCLFSCLSRSRSRAQARFLDNASLASEGKEQIYELDGEICRVGSVSQTKEETVHNKFSFFFLLSHPFTRLTQVTRVICLQPAD